MTLSTLQGSKAVGSSMHGLLQRLNPYLFISSSHVPLHPLLFFSIFSSYLFSDIILLSPPLLYSRSSLSSFLTFLMFFSSPFSTPPISFPLHYSPPHTSSTFFFLILNFCALSILKIISTFFSTFILFFILIIIIILITITLPSHFFTFIVHYEMDRLFCSKCGANHMSRVGASVNAKTGELKLHLKANYVVNTLGK